MIAPELATVGTEVLYRLDPGARPVRAVITREPWRPMGQRLCVGLQLRNGARVKAAALAMCEMPGGER